MQRKLFSEKNLLILLFCLFWGSVGRVAKGKKGMWLGSFALFR